MNEDYVNAFLTPAVHVWEKELAVKLTLSGAEQVASQYTTNELTALIGISGKLEGNVLYGFTQESAKRIASKMIGREVVEMDELALSAIGEIANMITGNAATLLANLGAVCEITPPVIIEPTGSRFTTFAGPQILVKYASELGPLHIRISMTENHEAA
ncbi:MAG: chemotaxis protein CheX [Chloroflexi bacterium]|nr:chemotaxis protein CheX [Chloroflexota bacterium]